MTGTALNVVKKILGGETFPQCESASLRLQKFVCFNEDEANKDDNAKKRTIEDVIGKRVVGKASEVKLKGERIIATLKSRLIVNQAGGILENAGLCLHRHFGYPYIPGSAVKGLARHAAWCKWKAEEDGERKLEIAKRIAQVFGYPTGDKDGLDEFLKPHVKECAGAVCFMAAEPVGKAPLVMDIVNCHHPKYYQGEQTEATDTENPIPNFFPAVEKGAQFQFQLIPLRMCSEEDMLSAKKWLVEAIKVHGIGAKTAAGYGWFEYVDVSGVEPDMTVIDTINNQYPSQSKLKDLVKNKELWEDSPVFRYSLLTCVMQKEFWERWNKNQGSKEMAHLKAIAKEFGVNL